MELVGTSDSGTGVTGNGNSGDGVVGTGGNNGVVGTGGNNGVVGTGGNNGVSGTGGSVGVFGGAGNYGGEFQGGHAPLRLRPSDTQGAPNTGRHFMGELYVDNQGALYFCVADGTPGTWKRVQLV